LKLRIVCAASRFRDRSETGSTSTLSAASRFNQTRRHEAGMKRRCCTPERAVLLQVLFSNSCFSECSSVHIRECSLTNIQSVRQQALQMSGNEHCETRALLRGMVNLLDGTDSWTRQNGGLKRPDRGAVWSRFASMRALWSTVLPGF
jgi:hypothetical protein